MGEDCLDEGDALHILLDDAPCLSDVELYRAKGSPVPSVLSICSSQNSVSSGDISPLPSHSHFQDESFPVLTEEDYLQIDASVDDTTATPEKKPNVTWNGFKLVGDNLDIRVKPRHQTMELKVKDHHAFAYIGVKDRINLSAFSDSNEPPVLSDEHIKTAIPDSHDCRKMEENFCVLIARILTKHMPEFEEFASFVPSHIHHKYSSEMSTKSEIVSANPPTIFQLFCGMYQNLCCKITLKWC